MSLDTERGRATPEGVRLSLRIVGPPARFAAWLLDVLILGTVQTVVMVVLALLGEGGMGLMLLALFALNWFYPVAFELLHGGSTPGKSALGLMVVCDDGRPVGAAASLLRNFLRVADFMPMFYGAGLISMLTSRDFQRLGDIAAGTLVVYRDVERQDQARMPDAHPVPLPAALSRAEQRALVDFGTRLPEWSLERAIEIADVAAPLTGQRGRLGLDRLLGMAHWVLGRRSAAS